MPEPADRAGLVLGVGLPDACRRRVGALDGIEVTDDVARVADAGLVLLSTRVPRAELTNLMATIAPTVAGPVVALVHTGGEQSAVEVVRRGGRGVLAEGNEAGLVSFLNGDAGAQALLETYDREVARTEASPGRTRGTDTVTGLPDGASLEARLDALSQDDVVPRVALLRIVRTPGRDVLNEDGASLVRRRLASQFLAIARNQGCDLFALSGWDFALVGPDLEPDQAELLGHALDSIADTYAPGGSPTLGVAMGHAGPEVTTDVTALVEAAQRAIDVAAADRAVVVVNADSLPAGVSATTELDAALRIVDHAERHTALGRAHGRRVGEVAAILGGELGYDGIARSRIQLAGHLHAIGLATMPDADAGPHDRGDVLASAGAQVVGAIVRAHREHWDGSGFPRGLTGTDIPVGARIVAGARCLVEIVDGAEALGTRMSLDEVADALRARSGTELDPDVVLAILDLLPQLVAGAGSLALTG